MSLQRIYERRVFDDATTDERRTRVSVSSGELAVHHEVLVLRVGDRPENLTSPETVMKTVLDTIAVVNHRFSNIDESVLRAAAADEWTETGTQVEHRGSLVAPVVSYSASIKEAYQSVGFGQNPAQVRNDLEDVLRKVSDSGYRPVLVLDDTEKFVSPGSQGKLDEESVENLYHHGVRARRAPRRLGGGHASPL